jgi:cysteine desulfurase
MLPLYLDANAHLPLSPKALKAYVDANSSLAGHGNAMSPSVPGREASGMIENARNKIAELIGADSANQIVFTSTCSQACEWAVYLLQRLVQAGVLNKVYMSPTEHSAVKFACRDLIPELGELHVTSEGNLTGKHPFGEKDAAVCIHVQNELGVIQPIENLDTDFILSDMSQDLGKLPTKLSRYPKVKLATFGAHKFGGPGGVGFMFVRDTNIWKEFGTGSRYYFDRPGTPDAASVHATAVALEEAVKTISERYQRMIAFRDTLEPGLLELGWKIIGRGANRVPNTTFAIVAKTSALHLLAHLGSEGIHVGLGSACGSVSTGPSPLMAALGHGGNSNDYMRISQFGEYGANEAKLVLAKLRRYCPKEGDIP